MTISDVLSLFRLIPQVKKFIEDRRKRRSWRTVGKIIRQLHTEMNSESFHPDVVLGIGREGSIVASLFALNWRLKPFCVLDRSFVLQKGDIIVQVHDTVPTDIVKGRKVLLIDCEVNTGNTMRTTKQFLLETKHVCEVRTMALAKSVSAGFTPDYVGMQYSERPYWPWEYTDEIKMIRHERDLHQRH